MATAERREFLIRQAERMAPLAGKETTEKWKDRLAKGNCPMCGNPIDESEFRDELSRAEYALSHMCMKCQDKVFGPEE